MIWASWRQQRLQLITLLGLLVVGVGAIALLRSSMLDSITSAQLTACVTQPLQDCAVPEAAKAFQEEWSNPLDMARLLIICVPALIGVFIGAPLFARELEQGTYVLAFTQSVSRTRWMLSKLVIALVPALVVLIALQYLVTWWLSAAGTLGNLASATAGNVERAGALLRHGGELATGTHYRLFAKAAAQEPGAPFATDEPQDRWKRGRAGFRADRSDGADTFTVQGEAARSRVGDTLSTGLLVPPENPASIAAAVGRLAADPVLGTSLGEAARSLATAQFTRAASASRFAGLYARVASASRSKT